MVRTVCCETFKCTGNRCSICPERPENRENVRKALADQATSPPLGRRLGIRLISPLASTQPST